MSQNRSAPNATVRTGAIVWTLLGLAAVLFIFLDHLRAPFGLLPAEWYCRLGAGEWVTGMHPSGTRFCKQGTIWAAILGRPFYIAP